MNKKSKLRNTRKKLDNMKKEQKELKEEFKKKKGGFNRKVGRRPSSGARIPNVEKELEKKAVDKVKETRKKEGKEISKEEAKKREKEAWDVVEKVDESAKKKREERRMQRKREGLNPILRDKLKEIEKSSKRVRKNKKSKAGKNVSKALREIAQGANPEKVKENLEGREKKYLDMELKQSRNEALANRSEKLIKSGSKRKGKVGEALKDVVKGKSVKEAEVVNGLDSNLRKHFNQELKESKLLPGKG